MIEILAVISIIIILAGITIGIIGYTNNKALRDRTVAEVKFIELQLERFKNETGDYPTANYNQTNNLYNMLGRTNVFVNRPIASFKPAQVSTNNLIDPYGNLYGYQSPGYINPGGFDLWSTGGAGTATNSANAAAYLSATNNPNSMNINRWISNWRR